MFGLYYINIYIVMIRVKFLARIRDWLRHLVNKTTHFPDPKVQEISGQGERL
jgi:hypothetical protein